MRSPFALLLAMLVGLSLSGQAFAEDQIEYLDCRADNDSTSSYYGLNDTTQKVCDPGIQDTWFAPLSFDAKKVMWNDGASLKTIYRTGKNRRYEHSILILNHVGKCKHMRTPPAKTCKN